MKMNDNTILRIKVPASLYESVKAQLTLKEAKGGKVYGAGMEEVKGQKTKGASSDKPKASAPKKPAATKNANASVKVTPYNAVKANKETSKMGAGVSEAKKMGLEELKKLAELLNNEITKLEEKSHDKDDKEKVEEAFDMAAMAATTDIANKIKSALKAGQKVVVNGKEIEGIESGRIKVKHTGPRHGITGGSGLQDIDLSNVDSLFIDGEEQTLPQPEEPEVQDVSQPSKPQWDFTSRWPDIPLG